MINIKTFAEEIFDNNDAKASNRNETLLGYINPLVTQIEKNRINKRAFEI